MKTDLTWKQFEQGAKQALSDVMEYARRADAIFGRSVCTYNLHSIACKGLM